MMNGQANQPGAGAGLDARLRVIRILWGAFLMSIGLYVLLCVFVAPPREAGEDAGNETMLAVLAATALVSVALSFLIKGRFYRRAAERGEPEQAQIGFIVALALCEVAALFGLVGLFVTQNKYAYLLFALGALGQLLHFPRRDELAAAYRKGW